MGVIKEDTRSLDYSSGDAIDFSGTLVFASAGCKG